MPQNAAFVLLISIVVFVCTIDMSPTALRAAISKLQREGFAPNGATLAKRSKENTYIQSCINPGLNPGLAGLVPVHWYKLGNVLTAILLASAAGVIHRCRVGCQLAGVFCHVGTYRRWAGCCQGSQAASVDLDLGC